MEQQNNTHSVLIGYVLWIFGFTGSHRFYFGKPISGTIYFFTLGLLGIGWLIDLFLIPSMDRQADLRFHSVELNRYAVVFSNPPSFGQDKLFPHLIQSGFFVGSC